jgi:hypothetical protein
MRMSLICTSLRSSGGTLTAGAGRQVIGVLRGWPGYSRSAQAKPGERAPADVTLEGSAPMLYHAPAADFIFSRWDRTGG